MGGCGGVWSDHPFFSSLSHSLPHLSQLILSKQAQTPTQASTHFHQSDLRKKHSSIPERRRHISRSSGNRGRLMKCRLALHRERGGKNRLPNKVIEKFDDVRFQSARAPCRRRVFGFRLSAVKFQNHVSKIEASCRWNRLLKFSVCTQSHYFSTT